MNKGSQKSLEKMFALHINKNLAAIVLAVHLLLHDAEIDRVQSLSEFEREPDLSQLGEDEREIEFFGSSAADMNAGSGAVREIVSLTIMGTASCDNPTLHQSCSSSRELLHDLDGSEFFHAR
jgi:hypothetical protein